MGILGFRRLLEPYATIRRTKIEPCQAVVDGPALAYHILRLCLRRTLKSSPFEQPPYKLLSKTVISWLDNIEECGIHVCASFSTLNGLVPGANPSLSSALYFDGLLPRWKKSERMQRVLETSRQLQRYRLAYPDGVPRQRLEFDENVPVELFPFTKPQEKDAHVAAPIPGFLVPAIIDALSSSPVYGPRVKVVGGEADGFCAEDIRAHGGLVLTSDSDFLVHDLGNNGGVVFLTDISLDMETKALTAPLFRIRDICARLSLKPNHGLSELAFEMVTDPDLTVGQAAELVRRSAAATSSPSAYKTFLQQYVSPETALAKSDDGPTLDPRISELALRCLSTGTDSDQKNNDLAIYLPFLLDYQVRTSAWEQSKRIRRLAYSLLQLVQRGPVPSVAEFRRPLTPSSGLEVKCLAPIEIGKESSALLDVMCSIEAGLPSTDLVWMALAAYQDIDLSLHQGKQSPPCFELFRQSRFGALDQASWRFIHFLAQVQGALYSLRILKQILEFTAYHAPNELPPEVAKLRVRLAGLPPLTAFPSVGDFGDMFYRFGTANGLQCLSHLFSEEQEVLEQIEAIHKPPTPAKERGTEREIAKKRKATTPMTPPAPTLSRNPFDVLARAGLDWEC
jgi:hypothetical protein